MAYGLLHLDLISIGGEPMAHLMTQLETIFGVGRRWSSSELYQTLEMSRIPSIKEECDLIMRYHRTLPNKAYFPQSVSRLIEQWTSCVDKARMAVKPRGVLKDPVEINRRKVESRMALLKARATDPETHEWLQDRYSKDDRIEYERIKEQL